jgi:hypothetical protein
MLGGFALNWSDASGLFERGKGNLEDGGVVRWRVLGWSCCRTRELEFCVSAYLRGHGDGLEILYGTLCLMIL